MYKLNRIAKIINDKQFKILFIIFTATLLYFLYWRIYFIFLTYPNLGGAENYVIYSIQRFLNGHPLYENPEAVPFPVTQYAPLHYLINYCVAKLFSIPPESELQIFYLNRILSLIYNILHCFLIYIIAKDIFNTSKIKSYIAAVCAFILIECFSFARPDSLYFVFVMTSFYFFLKYISQNKSSYLVLNIFGVCLSIYSKQTGIVLCFFYPLMIFLIHRNYRKPFYYSVYLFSALFISFSPFLLHHFHHFYQNFVAGVNNGVDLPWFWENIVVTFFVRRWGAYFFIAGIYLFVQLYKTKEPKNLSLAFAMLIFFVFGMGTGLKYGSRTSYFTEFISFVLIAIVSCRYKIKINATATFVLLVLFAGMKIYYAWFNSFVESSKYNDIKENYSIEKQIQETLKTDYELTRENLIFVHDSIEDSESFLNNIFFEQVLFPHKDISYSAVDLNVYDYSEFQEILNQNKVKYYITKENNPCLHFMRWSSCEFTFIFKIKDYYVFKN